MTAMQASVLRAVHDLALEQRPVPRPVLVTCSSRSPQSGYVARTCTTSNTGASAIAWSVNRSSSAMNRLVGLVTGHYPLAAVRDALTANLTDPGTVKVVVTPSA
jgi:hypothetical protein